MTQINLTLPQDTLILSLPGLMRWSQIPDEVSPVIKTHEGYPTYILETPLARVTASIDVSLPVVRKMRKGFSVDVRQVSELDEQDFILFDLNDNFVKAVNRTYKRDEFAPDFMRFMGFCAAHGFDPRQLSQVEDKHLQAGLSKSLVEFLTPEFYRKMDQYRKLKRLPTLVRAAPTRAIREFFKGLLITADESASGERRVHIPSSENLIREIQGLAMAMCSTPVERVEANTLSFKPYAVNRLSPNVFQRWLMYNTRPHMVNIGWSLLGKIVKRDFTNYVCTTIDSITCTDMPCLERNVSIGDVEDAHFTPSIWS